MKTSALTKQQELDSLKKKFPVGNYNHKNYYSIQVLGYKHFGGVPVVKMKFINNPTFGRSQWFLDLKQTKIMLKEYKFQK